MTAEERLRCDKCDNDAVRFSLDSHLCLECYFGSKEHKKIQDEATMTRALKEQGERERFKELPNT